VQTHIAQGIGMVVLGQDNISMSKKVDIQKEIKLINRRTEETLSIVIEHFKEMEERMDALEKKIKQK
jgi:hypothetical protein